MFMKNIYKNGHTYVNFKIFAPIETHWWQRRGVFPIFKTILRVWGRDVTRN